jgi:hypothetical protein
MPMRPSHRVYPLTYLKVRLRNNAKTYSARRYCFIFLRFYYLFWRFLFTAICLQATKVVEAIATVSPFSSTKQSLQLGRGNSSANLPIPPGIKTVGDNPSPETQRSLSIPYRPTCISRSHHSEAISASDSTFSIIQIEKTSRSPFAIDDSQAQTSHRRYLRSGPNRPHLFRWGHLDSCFLRLFSRIES